MGDTCGDTCDVKTPENQGKTKKNKKNKKNKFSNRNQDSC